MTEPNELTPGVDGIMVDGVGVFIENCTIDNSNGLTLTRENGRVVIRGNADPSAGERSCPRHPQWSGMSDDCAFCRATPDAGDILEATTLLLADPRFHGPHLTWDGPTVRVLLQTILASDWFAARLDAAYLRGLSHGRSEGDDALDAERERIAQAIEALPTMGKFAPGVWIVRESAARIARESR